MKYNNLGRSGVKVSELSFGSWINFGSVLDVNDVKTLMKFAHDHGVNFFDNAETYSKGQSEVLMGEGIKMFRREDLVVTTKIYWGGNGPNDIGTSWKRLVEGTKASLKRMKLEYVDVLYCHRYDQTTPIEETVRAMDHLIRSGLVFYWGTSEWTQAQLEQAYLVCDKYNCFRPTVEQPQYNMFERKKVEHDFKTFYDRFGLGLTTWSPLASGILTGKYNSGIPKGSRLESQDILRRELTTDRIERVKKLLKVSSDIGCSPSQLAIAWCLKNPNVSSVILGATNVDQLFENLNSINIKSRLTDEVMKRIEDIIS